MKIPFGKPLIDSKERMAVQKVLSGNILVHGPKIIEFEKNSQNLQNQIIP